MQQRWRGYAEALESAQIPLNESDVLLFNGIADQAFAAYLPPFLDGFGKAPLSAVVCSNDSTALRLLRFLRAEERTAAVTGYGDLLPNYMEAMGLTTVSQPFEDLGRAVGTLLLSRLAESGGGPADFRQIDLPVHLIVRSSTGMVVPKAV